MAALSIVDDGFIVVHMHSISCMILLQTILKRSVGNWFTLSTLPRYWISFKFKIESGIIDSTICFALLRIEMSAEGGSFATGNTFVVKDVDDEAKDVDEAADNVFLGEGMIPLSRKW